MSIYFSDKSWPQLEEAIEQNTLILLPIGQTEQHGPHLPLSTDTVIATETARRVAERVKDSIPVLVMPTIWSAYSVKQVADWPGLIRLQPETLLNLVYDILASLAEMGFKKIVMINAHGNNPAILELASRKIGDTYGIFPAITYVMAMASEVGPKIRKSELGGCGGHACEAETSLMLYLSDLPDMSKAASRDIVRYHSRFFPGDIYSDIKKVPGVFWSTWGIQKSETGVYGDPTVATAEMGKQMMEAIVELHAEFLAEYYAHPGPA